MERRRGPGHNWAVPGPRLPIDRRKLRRPSDDALPDPADGARVPRCRVCGLPNPSDLVGTWNGLEGRLPVCQRCWFEVNPPDPLAIAEVVAR